MMMTTETTETSEATHEAALEAARRIITALEADLAALPNAYAQRELRIRRIDDEEELRVARIRACRAELATLTAAAGALREREAGVIADIATTDAALIRARAAFDEAAQSRNVAENAAGSLRWEQQASRMAILAAQDKLAALTSQPMPD